jgi:hypothetical protein
MGCYESQPGGGQTYVQCVAEDPGNPGTPQEFREKLALLDEVCVVADMGDYCGTSCDGNPVSCEDGTTSLLYYLLPGNCADDCSAEDVQALYDSYECTFSIDDALFLDAMGCNDDCASGFASCAELQEAVSPGSCANECSLHFLQPYYDVLRCSFDIEDAQQPPPFVIEGSFELVGMSREDVNGATLDDLKAILARLVGVPEDGVEVTLAEESSDGPESGSGSGRLRRAQEGDVVVQYRVEVPSEGDSGLAMETLGNADGIEAAIRESSNFELSFLGFQDVTTIDAPTLVFPPPAQSDHDTFPLAVVVGILLAVSSAVGGILVYRNVNGKGQNSANNQGSVELGPAVPRSAQAYQPNHEDSSVVENPIREATAPGV